MNYDRIKLLEYVDKALAEHRARWERDLIVKKKEYEAAREAWMERFEARWTAALHVMAKSIAKGNPVTEDMLPYESRGRGYCDYLGVFHEKPPSEEYEAPKSLLVQKALLEACTGDEVSSRELKSADIMAIAENYVVNMPSAAKKGK